MNRSTRLITETIRKRVNEGESLEEALQSIGAKKWMGDNTYYIPCDEYQDKLIIFKIKLSKG